MDHSLVKLNEIYEPCRVGPPGTDGSWWRVLTNVFHWRREWQTTSVFLPWEAHEQNDKAKRYNHKQAATHEVLDQEKLDKRCEWLKWPSTTCRTALQDSLLWGNWYCYLSPSIKSGIWTLNLFLPPDPQYSITHELFSLSDELLTAHIK